VLKEPELQGFQIRPQAEIANEKWKMENKEQNMWTTSLLFAGSHFPFVIFHFPFVRFKMLRLPGP